MVSACHSIARWLTKAGRLVAILYASISPYPTPRPNLPSRVPADNSQKVAAHELAAPAPKRGRDAYHLLECAAEGRLGRVADLGGNVGNIGIAAGQ